MRSHEDLLFVKDGDMSSDIFSKHRDVYYMLGCSFHLSWTSSPSGSFKLQWSNELSDPWCDLEESNYSPKASQNYLLYNVRLVYFKYIRVVWTHVSGSGILQCKYIGKGVG